MPSSWVAKGIIDFLLSDSACARILRKNYVIRIIPMLNPDGVIYGNYRCCLLGYDLNRQWKFPDRLLQPTIFYTKEVVRAMSEEREVAFYCDLHAHSIQRNIFMYGCSCEDKDFNAIYRNSVIRIAPLLLSYLDKNFSYSSSRFQMEKCKESTARIVFFKEFNIVNSYTCESSFFGYIFCLINYNRPSNSTYEYEKIGESLCKVLLLYLPLKGLKGKLLELIQSIASVLSESIESKQISTKAYIAEMNIKEEIKMNHIKLFSIKSMNNDFVYMTNNEYLELIKNIDIERLVEAVREEKQYQKIEEVDDDISSIDSEQERNKIILRKKILRKKRRRKNKKAKKKVKRAMVEEQKPKISPLSNIKSSSITKVTTRSELPKKVRVPDNKKIVPLYNYVQFIDGHYKKSSKDCIRGRTADGRRIAIEGKVQPVQLSLYRLQITKYPNTKRWLNSQASVTLGFFDEQFTQCKCRASLSKRYSVKFEQEDQRKTLDKHKTQIIVKPRTISTLAQKTDIRQIKASIPGSIPEEGSYYNSVIRRKQKYSHEARRNRIVFARNRQAAAKNNNGI